MKQGYVQVYTGEGKGKTTAALGLTLRAVGAGLRVCIIQFFKGGNYSEINALYRFSDLVTIKQFGLSGFIVDVPTQSDIETIQKGYYESLEVIESGNFDVIILDEILIAYHFDIISVKDLQVLVEKKPTHVELILTGRKAPEEIVAIADLVTEMKDIKHYFHQGVPARIGIEK